MKIELDPLDSRINSIMSYSDKGVIIQNILYQSNIIVSPKTIIEDFEPEDINKIDRNHLATVLNTQPEIVLIGTGMQIQFPQTDVLDVLRTENIGVEVMDTGAACRAYNFIAGEGRMVTAILFHPTL